MICFTADTVCSQPVDDVFLRLVDDAPSLGLLIEIDFDFDLDDVLVHIFLPRSSGDVLTVLSVDCWVVSKPLVASLFSKCFVQLK